MSAGHQPQRGGNPHHRRADRQHRQEPGDRAQQHRPRHAGQPQAERGQDPLHHRGAENAVDHAAHGGTGDRDQPVGAVTGNAPQQIGQPPGDRLAIDVEEERDEQRKNEQQHALGDAEQQVEAALERRYRNTASSPAASRRYVGGPAVPRSPTNVGPTSGIVERPRAVPIGRPARTAVSMIAAAGGRRRRRSRRGDRRAAAPAPPRSAPPSARRPGCGAGAGARRSQSNTGQVVNTRIAAQSSADMNGYSTSTQPMPMPPSIRAIRTRSAVIPPSPGIRSLSPSLSACTLACGLASRPITQRLLPWRWSAATGQAAGPRCSFADPLPGRSIVPRFAANLSMMFNERAFLDRFDAAAQGRIRGLWSSCFPTSFPAVELTRRLERRGPDPGAVQHAARRLGERRARAGQPARPAGGIPRGGEAGARLRRDARTASWCTAWPASCRPAVSLTTAAAVYAANLAWAGEQALAAGVKLVDRADQSPRHAGLFPEHRRRRARRSSRRSASTASACSSTSITADHRGRHHQADGAAHAGDRAHADRRRAGDATSRAPARSAGRSCSGAWTSLATPAGSAASIAPPATPSPDWPGGSVRRLSRTGTQRGHPRRPRGARR